MRRKSTIPPYWSIICGHLFHKNAYIKTKMNIWYIFWWMIMSLQPSKWKMWPSRQVVCLLRPKTLKVTGQVQAQYVASFPHLLPLSPYSLLCPLSFPVQINKGKKALESNLQTCVSGSTWPFSQIYLKNGRQPLLFLTSSPTPHTAPWFCLVRSACLWFSL